jgi:thymidylate synthase (FAD)
MKIIEPSFEILHPNDAGGWAAAVRHIETAARTCYKSESKDSVEDTLALVARLKHRRHYAMLEFGRMTVRFVIDRGVSHELVRHRLCSFAQESTRYCNYSDEKFGKELTFIVPSNFRYWTKEQGQEWSQAVRAAELHYMFMIESGLTPQEARSVLPNSLKTEIVVDANFTEWLHIFELRDSPAAHPDMLYIMSQLHLAVQKECPVIFGA